MVTSRVKITVRYSETSQMGFAAHDSVVPWFELARTTMLKEHGLDYREFEAMGYLMPVLELGVKYLRPARYDEALSIVTTLPSRPSFKVRLEYGIWRDEELLAEGYTIQAFVNQQQRPVKPPSAFLAKIDALFPKKRTSSE